MMKHKVTCMDCGKTERIEVGEGKSVLWAYYGKININSCQTDKYYFRVNTKVDGKLDFDNLEKVSNSCYNPEVKPKFVEMWSCPECQKLELQKK